MRRTEPPLTINMSSIRVAGFGGLGMVATIVVMAIAIPAARALLVAGLLTGALLAWWLIRSRRERPLDHPGDSGPILLGLASAERIERRGDIERDPPTGGRLMALGPRSLSDGLAAC